MPITTPSGEQDAAAKAKARQDAEALADADKQETAAKLDAMAPQAAAMRSSRRPRRDPMKAAEFKILFNGVGPHTQGAVVTREALGADDASLGNLLSLKAIEAYYGEEDGEE